MGDGPIARATKIGELEFLRKIQRLLNEGDFSATYKFALLNALADLSVERQPAADDTLVLPLSAIAEKFIEFYWPQARPFDAVRGDATILQQNTGRQAAVITALVEQHAKHSTLSVARRSNEWPALVNRVSRIIRVMPLWKLQTVGSEIDEFLYRRADFRNDKIQLRSGVAGAFRSLHGIVLDAVRGAWMRQIACIGVNRRMLGDADLATFLFGSERRSLAPFARVLRDHQKGICHYCQRTIAGPGVVDHFVAWSRYPVDLGHNLVLSHAGCNGSKRDFLAHPRHLESWHASNMERSGELVERLNEGKLPHDFNRTVAIAWWAYQQGELAGAHAWIRGTTFERLDATWRDALQGTGIRHAAEIAAPDY
ncbi:MAG: HNH endonuclease [Gammaproteobacteria bacterium]